MKTATITAAYKGVIKKILFKIDPEKTHNSAIKTGKKLGSNKITKALTSSLFNYQNPILEQSILNIKFKNPVGLSAGFDKNAEIIPILESVGFGFAEVGSITAKPCKGNKGIRIKRMPKVQGLWINLGLNNEGADVISKKLKNLSSKIPVGISIAKTNCKETVDEKIAIEDYSYSIKKFQNIGEYITINISCPNAYGGQPFSDPISLSKLLKEVSKLKIKKPIFIKMSPDLDKKTIDKIIQISKRYKISGFICSNLNKKHKEKSGGISGKFVEDKANSLLSYIYKKTNLKSKPGKHKFVLIGVGGIFSAEDAYKKIKLGANLVQIITGMIYEGPQLIGQINRGLVKLLKRDGFSNISQAVGSAYKN